MTHTPPTSPQAQPPPAKPPRKKFVLRTVKEAHDQRLAEKQEAKREHFLAVLRTGLTISDACRIARVSREEIYKAEDQIQDFGERFDEAKRLSARRRAEICYQAINRYLSKRARKGWMAREQTYKRGSDGKLRIESVKYKRMFSPEDARYLHKQWGEQAGVLPKDGPAVGGGVGLQPGHQHLHLHNHLHQAAAFDPDDLTTIINEPRASGAYRVCRELRDIARIGGGNALVLAVGADAPAQAGTTHPASS